MFIDCDSRVVLAYFTQHPVHPTPGLMFLLFKYDFNAVIFINSVPVCLRQCVRKTFLIPIGITVE